VARAALWNVNNHDTSHGEDVWCVKSVVERSKGTMTINDMRSWHEDAACVGTGTENWYPKTRPDRDCNATHVADITGVALKDVQEILTVKVNGNRKIPSRISQDEINYVRMTAVNIGYEPMTSDDEIATLRTICAGCPVIDKCAEWSLHHEAYGFWAGMLASERDEIRKAKNILVKDPMSMGTTHSKSARREEQERLLQEYGE
jgi:hypothetical protein